MQKQKKTRERNLEERRKAEIASLAESVFEENFDADQYIDPETVARNYKITFSYGDYEDAFDGLLEHEFGRFHIYINTARSLKHSPRSRFSFGHELGHFFIDEHRNPLKKGKVPAHASYSQLISKNPVEREANHFASCLLMPAGEFVDYCNGAKLSSSLIEEISEYFDTSISATLFRYYELNLLPMVIVITRNGNIEKKFIKPDFKYQFLPKKGSKVPKSSVAGEFFYQGIKRQSEETVFPDDWFTDFEMDKSDELVEKCYYRNNTVLSVIWMKEDW